MNLNNIKRLIGLKKKTDTKETTISTIHHLREMEEMLGKKQDYLEEQIKMQMSLAKKHGLKNKRAALSALKRKKRFEAVLQQVDGTLSTLEMQREALEQAKNNVSVLNAMKSAAKALQSAQQYMSVDKVNDIMDEISEQQEVAQEISQAISNPITPSFGLDYDEAELELELETLEQEDLERELLHINTVNTVQDIGVPGKSKDEAVAEVNKVKGKPLETGSGVKAKADGPASGSKSQEAEDSDFEELKSWAAG